MKIVGKPVDNYCTSDDLLRKKAGSVEHQQTVSHIGEEGRKVPCVLRMGTAAGIVVGFGIGKGIFGRARTDTSLMQMKAQKALRASGIGIGKPDYLSGN